MAESSLLARQGISSLKRQPGAVQFLRAGAANHTSSEALRKSLARPTPTKRESDACTAFPPDDMHPSISASLRGKAFSVRSAQKLNPCPRLRIVGYEGA